MFTKLLVNNYLAGLGTFTADPVLSQSTILTEPGAQFSITADSLGVSTVTSSSTNPFVGIQTGDIVTYTKQGFTIPTFNKVIEVTNSQIKIAETTDLANINDGALPTVGITANDFKKVSLEVLNTSNAFLFAKLNHKNVESLDLSTSSIILRKVIQCDCCSKCFFCNT